MAMACGDDSLNPIPDDDDDHTFMSGDVHVHHIHVFLRSYSCGAMLNYL